LNSRLKRFLIYFMIFALFLPSWAGLLSPKKAKAANAGDSNLCSITASYTVSNGYILIDWGVSIKDPSIKNFTVTLDQENLGGQVTLNPNEQYYRTPVPNPDRNIMFTINVNTSDVASGDGICVNQFQYKAGSTSGGGAVIPTPTDKCKDAPIAFITSFDDTSTVPEGNVGLKIVWEGSAPGLDFEDPGSVYQDGKFLASTNAHYEPMPGKPDANKYYYKVNFPHTESHSWYVTQKIKGCAAVVTSNTVKYDGTTGAVSGNPAGAAAALGGNPTGYNDPNASSGKNCGCPSSFSLNPLDWILSPLCSVMCIFIDSLIEIMAGTFQTWLIDAVK
jgi:hypothetical protein